MTKRTGIFSKFSGQELAMLIFDAVMAILYFVIGLILLFAPLFHSVFKSAHINDGLRMMLGIILGLYGMFRIYRSIRRLNLKDR
ncbi:MAG: hypothetical protein LBU22_09630 [Dysgonamonadaceae bacterium]|nr:hypothetical protein [Dysgonamonadaceae bacterium]